MNGIVACLGQLEWDWNRHHVDGLLSSEVFCPSLLCILPHSPPHLETFNRAEHMPKPFSGFLNYELNKPYI